MAAGGGPFEEGMDDHDLPNWSNESLDDRLNNTSWGGQPKRPNKSSEKNKKKVSSESETRLTNDISPESTPGVGRRKSKTPHSFPHTRYMTQMSVPEQAELEKLKQRINFSDLDQRSIGSDSQGRATAANNKRQLNENKKPFNFLSLQINTNKGKDGATSSQTHETSGSSQYKDLITAALSKDLLQNCPVSIEEDGRGEPAVDSSQIVSRLVQIRDYIAKASSMRDDLVEKNERSANVERLSHLINHLKDQEKSYLKFLQKILARKNEEEDGRTVDSAVGSGSVAESTSLNIDVQSEVSDTTARDPQQEATEELVNLKKQHDLLKRMLQQQEQLKALQGRQAALLALQHKAEQAIAVMDDSVGRSYTEGWFYILLLSKRSWMICPSFWSHVMLPGSGSPQRSVDQRSATSVASAPVGITAGVNEEPNSLASSVVYHPDSVTSQNESEEDDNLNATEKLQKLNEVRKRLNELRELVHYYEQTSDMMTDAVNENTKGEEETEDSECDSDLENPQPVTNIRNPQGISNWSEINCNSNLQCGTNNRSGSHLNTACEINNRSANIRMLNMPSTVDCHYNREDDSIEIPQGEDDDIGPEADRASEASLSSRRSSIVDEAPVDAEFEQKINRLIAAKQKLRQLQNLVAMVQDDEGAPESAGRDNVDQYYLAEEEKEQQQPNNVLTSANKSEKAVVLNEKAREKFYEAKLQQQQRELKHLQEERKKLIKIQEKIQVLQKACPDLQLSSSLDNCPGNTSAPTANEINVGNKAVDQPEEKAMVDSELWSEMRRHELLREELRQRRKQLEALMAEHQRRRDLADTTSAGAASVKSDGSETQCTPQQSRTEKTMATWGGSTQCALDEDEGDEDAYLSDGLAQAEEEEEEEQDSSSNELSICSNNVDQSSYCAKEDIQSWKNPRPLSADGNYRPLAKAKQQQNISMRRQENHRWMSELSYVEEKEQWQEQINQLKKQLEFSVSICQTLMQDQQNLSCLLQTLLTGPYSVMPSNVASPQVHLIMHQLNQCYSQLTWQQNNVQRLKQMLNDLMHHQEQQQAKTAKKKKSSSAPPPPSPTVFCPFSFPSQTMNLFNMPGFTNFSSFPPGINFSPMFPPGLGDFSQNCTAQNNEQQPLEHNTTGKTDYMAFPKPFESSSTPGAEKPRGQRQSEEELESRSAWLNEHQGGGKEKPLFLKTGFAVPVQNTACGSQKGQPDTGRRREFDEESLESYSSMPDPVDPTTVTKTFKPRKASAQASLASKDKTPKSKSKRSTSQFKNRPRTNGFESASASSTCEPYKRNRSRHSTRKEEATQAKVFSKKNREQLEKIIKYSRSSEMSSAHARRLLQQSNRNACLEPPETGSDLSMFEALRDTIYSEVATLISQNESRPHFLIELFHELQMLNTDYLRQRALYALQDIVTRHASDDNEKGECPKPLSSAAWAGSNSELTPSESLATTDDETFEKNFDQGACRECEKNDADNGSTMSISSNFEPFATDDLGNTVIHLDQALARMREYERMKMAAESNLDSEDGCSNVRSVSSSKPDVNICETDTVWTYFESHSAAQPTEVPAVPCPRIDTQQLDRQIKAIMKEVIPFLKEHMDEVCSTQLLTSVRRMVLTLTQQNDESKEFVKIFHKQLGSILQDSLAKFAGKKLKDCGEDLLVEISEVLFNELAFFKLMQDLDNNSLTVKQRCKRKVEADGTMQSYAKEAKRTLEGGACSSTEDIDEDKDKDETETLKQVHESAIFNNREVPRTIRSDASDQEEEENESCPVSISLSKAETQALTNYGSGEDENEDEEIDEFEEGPVDVQTSLQANNETTAENEQEQISQPKSENSDDCITVLSEQESVAKGDLDSTVVVPQYLNIIEDTQAIPVNAAEDLNPSTVVTEEQDVTLAENESHALVTVHEEPKSSSGTPESSVVDSPDTESPVLVNEYETGSGNNSQKSDEDDFVKVEDVSLKLAVYSEEELMKTIVEEAQTNSITSEILASTENHEDLVGDPQILKEPETLGAQSA
uniref:Pericentriolar material 1 n=1 Tax=Anolis carolinensis TaxID=28377 RepID=A0A803TSC3_ANOCA